LDVHQLAEKGGEEGGNPSCADWESKEQSAVAFGETQYRPSPLSPLSKDQRSAKLKRNIFAPQASIL
jgi:hypothetical protein